MQLRRGVLAALVLAAVGCSDATEPTLPNGSLSGDEMVPPPEDGDRAGNRYIVLLDPAVEDVQASADAMAATYQATLHGVFETAVQGFAATLPDYAVQQLLDNPDVISVETDQPAHVYDFASMNQTHPPSWGLDRVDQVDLPLDESFVFGATGAGVNIYVIDSGIRFTHSDFEDRATFVPTPTYGNFVGDGYGSADDCYGHGTAVAAVAAGATFGVAKDAKLWALRVLDCDGWGFASMAMLAVDWITKWGEKPAVVNMSLGYQDSPALRQAIEASIAAGFVYVVAAGNSIIPFDACMLTPANVPGAITVGATTSNDAESSWSNYGSCVDLLGPGSAIRSADIQSDDATSERSGTSMAAPHVAGTIAFYLQINPHITPAIAASMILGQATPGRIDMHPYSNQGGTPNLLLFSDPPPPPPNMAPTAGIAVVCPDLRCGFNSASTDPDGSLVDWSWDFGDGAISSGQTVLHEYGAQGTYTVSLTVTDNEGASDTVNMEVVVPTPQAERDRGARPQREEN